MNEYGADVNALSESLSFIYMFTSKGPALFAAVEGSSVTASGCYNTVPIQTLNVWPKIMHLLLYGWQPRMAIIVWQSFC